MVFFSVMPRKKRCWMTLEAVGSKQTRQWHISKKEYHEHLCHSLWSDPCPWDREANEMVQLSGTSNVKSEGIFLPSSLFLLFFHTGNVIFSFLVVWKCKRELHWYSANLFCILSSNCSYFVVTKFYKFLKKSDNSWWVTYYYLACVNWMIESKSTFMELLLILQLCLSHPITSLRLLLYKWNLNFICYGLDTELKSAKDFLFYFVLHHKCNNFGCVFFFFLFLQQWRFLMIAAIWENI